jgi:Cu/Ag efflux protein CusF
MHVVRSAIVVSALIAAPVMAQTAASSVGPGGVGAAATAETKAQVVGIDTASNSVALRGESGKVVNVAVNPDVADVGKLQLGDTVNIRYESAVLVRATKVKSDGIRERIDETAAVPESNGSTATARRVRVVATVQKIDQKHRTITIRGPYKTDTLQVGPDVSLKDIKAGDNVRAEFVEATAVLVTRDGAPIK